MTYLKNETEMDTIKDNIERVIKEFNKNFASISKRIIKNDVDKSNELKLNANKEVYQLRKSNAGFLLIINQVTFEKRRDLDLVDISISLNTRHGTETDVESLKETFRAFGYIPIVKRNLTHFEIKKAVKDVMKDSSEMGYDSVIVCILSHGAMDVVYGADSMPVYIIDIERIMASELFLAKPKILLIQACQGMIKQEAVPINSKKSIENGVIEHDGPSMSKNDTPMICDLLTGVSSVEGFESFRHTVNGSWYIQILCKKVKELAGNR